MKISVIVAYHNEKNYIPDCLASLAEQDYQDFEVILVCDGCKEPDVDAYGNLNISIIKNRAAGGVAAARNAGIEAADGEYLYFLDADDYIDTEVLGRLAGRAKADCVVYGGIKPTWYSRRVYYDNGEELDRLNGTEDSARFDGDVNDPYEYFPMRAKNLQSVTVLGMLIPREIVEKNSIRFCEEFKYYADLPFLIQVLSCVENTVYCEEGLYVKRMHNDPVNLPSLLQHKDEEKKVFESMDAYKKAKQFLKPGVPDKYLDYKFVMWLVTGISPFMMNAGSAKRKEVSLCLKPALECLGDDVYQMLGRHPKKLIRAGKKGEADGLAGKTKQHARFQTLLRVCTSRAKMKRYLYEKVFSKMKMLEDTVIFESFFGKSYSDSPKYIFEYLNQNAPGKYRYIWVKARKKLELPYPAEQIKRFSFRYFFYMARAKYIVFNGRQPQYFIKRKGNVFLETWHGTPLKKLVFDMEDVTTASPLYKEQFYIQTRSWDYLVAPNQFSEDIFRRAFMYDGKMLETGYPRNDILYSEDKERLTREIKAELGLPEDKKVILYAPTWRDDEFYGHAQYKFSLQLDLDKMKKELGEEYVVILRTHYFIADFLELTQYGGFAWNLSKYDDIARLYLISDLLITDYSSVFFDYANLRRPMLFFTYDLEKYRSVLRGFYMDVEEELPGPMLFDTDEVIASVKNIDRVCEEYRDKYSRFCEKYCAWEDGHATEKVVRAVFDRETDV
ncbi:MAG: bifunctional glycosyltransferase family 2 protein/CDP-glycerol:glycerophosphate glycerophosphotransferase [Roseburia sp.]|nr:bifunctional glycosyltransferase family 2 protein/CDP-glycerol:glycerophosphate glycerophosphotransferase [Roseburia sp.]